MFTKIVFAVVVFGAVTYVKSEENYGRNNRMPEYVRIKRAKYYSNPPMRFYRKPPIPQPVRGIFSYTPPPNYMEEESQHPGSFRPTKVSKRPPTPNENLGQDDINNLVKHLSKQDLDKLINIAGEKYKESPLEKYGSAQNFLTKETDDINIYKSALRDIDRKKWISQSIPDEGANFELKEDVQYSEQFLRPMASTDNFRYIGPYAPSYTVPETQQTKPIQVFYLNQPQNINNNLQEFSDIQEPAKNNQFSFVDAYIKQELNSAPVKPHQVLNYGTVDKLNAEEQLPKPVNLREDDYLASNTDNVPRVVKASSYKIENFGSLPLMDYNSKLHTVSSYHVPHYSVISQQSQGTSSQSSSSSSQLIPSPSSEAITIPKIERAPHPSAAREQSDAHLKAIKIWTHMSSGTAYTLHDDGTLSLEKTGRPKPGHGH